jgi:hypothetical protein
MRVCYFWTKTWAEAVAALPEGAEQVYVGGHLTDYWDGIASRWGTDDLMIVEHDIVIHDDVVRQFEECPAPWCLFPYWHSAWLEQSLGCTRFRKELATLVSPQEIQEECWASCWECNPGLVSPGIKDMRDLRGWREKNPSEVLGCWRHLDGKIHWALTHRGMKPCVHTPVVSHLNHPLPGPGEGYISNSGI